MQYIRETVSIFLFAVTVLVGFSSVTMAQSTDDANIQLIATVTDD